MDELSMGGRLALTFEHVAAIPKRDSHDCIKAYVQRQQRFVRGYPSEEVFRANNQDTNQRSPGPGRAENSTKLTFGTPILKARVPVSREVEKESGTKFSSDPPRNVKTLTQKSGLPGSHLKSGEICSKNMKNNSERAHKPMQESSKRARTESHSNELTELSLQAAQEDGADTNTGDEHANRLEDRRQRKRKRKDIIAPPVIKDDLEKSYNEKRKKLNAKNTHIGFALMHGFSATNVGKNRLTLEFPGRDVGVFQKGKASRKTEVSEKNVKEQADRQRIFSEVKFLNSIDQKQKKPSRSCSPPSIVTSGGTQEFPQYPMTLNQRKTLIQKESTQETIKSSTSTIPSRKPYNPEESVVWGIEKKSNLTSNTGPNDRAESILVDYSHVFVPVALQLEAICSAENMKDMDVTDKLTDMRLAPDSTASPSLAPSQSASQVAQIVNKATQPGNNNLELADGPSKYFPKYAAAEQNVLNELNSTEDISDHIIIPGCPCPDSHKSSLGSELPPLGGCAGPPVYGTFDYLDESTQGRNVNPTLAKSLEPPYFHTSIRLQSNQSNLVSRFLDCCDDSVGFNDTQELYCYSSDSCVWSPQQLGACADYEDVLCNTFQDDPSNHWETFSDVEWEAISTNSIPLAAQYESSGFYHLQDTPLESFSSSQGNDHHPVYQSVTDVLTDDHILRNAELCPPEEQCNTSRADSNSDRTPDDGSFYDNFCQGRDLLYFYRDLSPKNGIQPKLSKAEAEVAGLLKGVHWLPQRL